MPSVALLSLLPSPCSSMATAAEERFIQWFREVGGELTPKLGLRDFEGMGRGAVALDDIEVSKRAGRCC